MYECVYELTRLEAQGKILGGRFIKKYSGIQFADKKFIKQKAIDATIEVAIHEKDCCLQVQ